MHACVRACMCLSVIVTNVIVIVCWLTMSFALHGMSIKPLSLMDSSWQVWLIEYYDIFATLNDGV